VVDGAREMGSRIREFGDEGYWKGGLFLLQSNAIDNVREIAVLTGVCERKGSFKAKS
jgi:hypothetical protein